jgi:Flp pilus assembly protein CpaB
MDAPLYAAAVPAEALDRLVGKQLTQPLYADQVLARAQLLSDPRPAIGPDQLALTIPVSPTTAAGGQLQPGDSVRVLVTTNKGKPDAQTSVVLDRAPVYDVGHDQSAVISAGASSGDPATRTMSRGPISSVTLVVSPDQAVALARARWNGDLDVALLPPQPAAQPGRR